jgi:hypothetical protein
MPIDIEKLEQLGFFRHVPEAHRARVKAWAVEHQFPFKDETRRVYHVDAEDLAEGAALSVLGAVAPFLHREGVPIEVTYRPVRFPARGATPSRTGVIEPDADGWLALEAYVKPWSKTPVEEMRIAPSPGAALQQVREDRDDDGFYILEIGEDAYGLLDPNNAKHAWEQATANLCYVLGQILRAHGSAERAYGIYGGNDLCLAFATEAMVELINGASEPGHRLHRGVPLARAASKI